MSTPDFIVLGCYFGLLLLIGVICSFAIKRQEDFFLGGRSFGKLLQTFAAFGAGTGSQDPINIGSKTWTSGLSGIWAALCWLFVTPFYWIFAVWYRRMRHLTLGDWFVERFQSKGLGAAYTLFAFSFQILYLSVMFSAISKVVDPLLGQETILQIVGWIGSDNPDDLKFILVPTIAIVVLAYGILGGLSAAYWTDLIQGLGIIALSIILIPTGLQALVDKYGDQYPDLVEEGRELSMSDGFTIMHDRLTGDFFQLLNTPQSGEFPIHYIIALVIMSLVGIVIQPHFIATGGGSAKSELSARVGLVSGNFLKRLCTVGWGLTGLIALALMAGNLELAEDPDRVWGVATQEILAPLKLGLVGLMVACLLAALMSSADTYMLVSSALLVRNVYAAYIDPNASERTYVALGRFSGLLIIAGSVFVSISSYNVFDQYVLALEVAASFAAPFWIGMIWRRGTKWAAWGTVLFSVAVFFIAPIVWPMLNPGMREQRGLLATTGIVRQTYEREATRVDVERREAEIQVWGATQEELQQASDAFDAALAEQNPGTINAKDLALMLAETPDLRDAQDKLAAAQAKMEKMGSQPEPLEVGKMFPSVFTAGGTSVFWSGGLEDLKTRKPASNQVVTETIEEDNGAIVTRSKYVGDLRGKGRFRVEYLVYHLMGIDFQAMDDATLKTLSLPPKIVTPFLVMILLSLVTPRCRREGLDRYYAKMQTPVDPDPERDQANLEDAYANPHRMEARKLFPGTNFEVLKPRWIDIAGFVISVGICFLFIQLIIWIASLGA